ncbi:acyl-CoA dehydrogenase family protein [Mycobacterium sp. CVI_P3]|uniref:Acyl-CoA dehydrogenase family protein n=1 Tax=Mycobacterium pinniadriaticum TaxID=2994102 RepID=A0ABT3SMX2_9MYCO|nr:acyl-CoA dehydrogenase family protein [Mycobacterium pinniadriaticum]MCX2934436.1 acyl-CoA dehydrogenase family protein [Mycobacterium pinniadriaticum]MCX2940859.1 acyl-CoA dehydrogenase family protein [Mycobacterium pinniadriaticum]
MREWLVATADSLDEFRHHHAEPVEDRWARDARFMRVLYDAGWIRYGWPVEYGGLGGPSVLRNVLYDELESAGYRVPEFVIQIELQGEAFMKFAPAFAEARLPAALRGDEMWAQGFSEPEAGSDLASLRCKAVLEGDEWVITGQKTWTSYGVSAQWMGVLTRTGSAESRHRGITMILVDLRSPGIEVRPLRLANGTDECADVFFDHVRVPVNNVIGEVNRGWDVAMYLLQFERANYGWLRQAHLARRLRELVSEIDDPDRATATVLGDCWLANLALRLRSGETVRRLFAGERIGPEASIDKILIAQAEQPLNDAFRDLLPGHFLFDPDEKFEVWRSEWYYSRAASIYGGAGEVQRGIIADRLLKLPEEA